MGCCNQAPKGGGDLKLGLKILAVFCLVVLALVVIFG